MSDPDLQRAFKDLRGANREKVPSFPIMRVRALARARAEVVPRRASPSWHLGGFAAVVAIAVCAIVWIGIPGQPQRGAERARSSSTERIEQLIASIDAHLTARMALSDWESPTDFLLNQNTLTPKNTSTP